jgi:hypothetical protein
MRRVAYTLSHVPGRIRINIPDSKHDAPLLQSVKQAIANIPGVREVEPNTTTGSVLMHYDAQRYRDFENDLRNCGKGAGLFALEEPRPWVSPRRGSRRSSEAGKAITRVFTSVDDDIRYATNNQLDLKVLLPLAAAGVGALQVSRSGWTATPLWLTLVIFAFSSFASLHSVDESTEETAEEALLVDGLA